MEIVLQSERGRVDVADRAADQQDRNEEQQAAESGGQRHDASCGAVAHDENAIQTGLPRDAAQHGHQDRVRERTDVVSAQRSQPLSVRQPVAWHGLALENERQGHSLQKETAGVTKLSTEAKPNRKKR